MINIKENNNNVNDFNFLYDSVGWGANSQEISKKALNNTFYSVSIEEYFLRNYNVEGEYTGTQHDTRHLDIAIELANSL